MYNLGVRAAAVIGSHKTLLKNELEARWPHLSEGMGLLNNAQYGADVFNLLPNNMKIAAKNSLGWGGRTINSCTELALSLLRRDPSRRELLIENTPPVPKKQFQHVFGAAANHPDF